MATRKHMVVGLFRDPVAAQCCIDSLLFDQGYAREEINVLMSEQTRMQHFPDEGEEREEPLETRSVEGMGVGGAIGTAVGASLAAIAAIGTSLVIPGLNVVIAGPLAAALAGGGAGAVTGGAIGALVGLGFTQENAQIYHDALQSGATVIGAPLRDDTDVEDVKSLMKACSGEQIHIT